MKIYSSPMRWEHSFKGHPVTVLEGAELARLLERLFHELKLLEEEKQGVDLIDNILIGVLVSWKKVHGKQYVITEEELKNHSSPDSRKIELFYKGIIRLFKQAEKRSNDRKDVFRKVRSSLGSFGISLN